MPAIERRNHVRNGKDEQAAGNRLLRETPAQQRIHMCSINKSYANMSVHVCYYNYTVQYTQQLESKEFNTLKGKLHDIYAWNTPRSVKLNYNASYFLK